MGHKAIQENGTTAYKLREVISSPLCSVYSWKNLRQLDTAGDGGAEGRAQAGLESSSGLPWGQATGKDVSVG